MRELSLREWEDAWAVPGVVGEAAEEAGLGRLEAMSLATAAVELANNVLVHAGSGFLRVRVVRNESGTGVEVTVTDSGPGIADQDAALSEGASTAGGLGVGLPGVRRLVDEFYLFSEKGVGTTVVVRKYVR
ncbi:ATP-binding protein [Candidatus Solincola tengchongensis]|uniref:ATP-binding protein n=1 Tax=Candidatus Solincola tengchongensis TaxID=2900693 RepID=UPI002580050F|nr:ATP-binding protein [Candidatus Solincola tengchongensis]